MRETKLSARAGEILDRLKKIYPDADCELDYGNAFELLIATILSAQCTDQRVNAVTPRLFARYPTPEDLAAARLPEVEEIIRSTGFFRAKARSITGCAQALAANHGGLVPRDFDEAVKLKGVGRKTASVVLGHAYAIAEGIASPNPYQSVGADQINLWAADGYHASVYGYYLEALVIFGSVTGHDPRSLGR